MTIKNRNVIITGFRKSCFCAIIFFMAISFVACAKDNDMILELKDVQFFQVQQSGAPTVTIKLSGLVFHSSLAIREITTETYDESLQILVHLTPVTGSLTGNLDYTLVIPASINTVSFGNDKSVLWTRSTGIVPNK